ncbi:MAG: fibrobacter succinogenes major paralogous domain-containing protein [Tannerellaceae bacterium]|nr:fibrobacter succinogenes major paralogous domain-containing protein [Tannerellaceae bacterium]
MGEVTREYLYVSGSGAGAVSAQAVVVYIVNVDGEIDYNAGYVAQVMGSTRNTTLDIYEPAAGNIHGGRVIWNLSDNKITTYTQGSSALPSKLSLSYNGVELVADNAIATLILSPEVISDYEGNIYPLVKIGAQVWTGLNWKSEFNMEGTPVTVYYFNDDSTANKNLYGGLYNWGTAVDDKFIPAGWVVPTLSEWLSMGSYLNNQGQKLKANILWYNLSNSDNMTGFRGLPGGVEEPKMECITNFIITGNGGRPL